MHAITQFSFRVEVDYHAHGPRSIQISSTVVTADGGQHVWAAGCSRRWLSRGQTVECLLIYFIVM